jgi:hypothetical protein
MRYRDLLVKDEEKKEEEGWKRNEGRKKYELEMGWG